MCFLSKGKTIIFLWKEIVLFPKMCREHLTNHLRKSTDTDCGMKLYTVTTNHCVSIVRVTIEIYVSHNSDLRMETSWERSSITEIYWIDIKFGVIPNECGIVYNYTNKRPIIWQRNLCSNQGDPWCPKRWFAIYEDKMMHHDCNCDLLCTMNTFHLGESRKKRFILMIAIDFHQRQYHCKAFCYFKLILLHCRASL